MTSKKRHDSGFALAITLVLLALILIVVVAYLASTRTERSTSSVYANRLRAQITAESGLAAAIHLLHDNTRYGNYITAIPAPSPSPPPLYTEIYRPADPADTAHAAKANDYLRMANAAGELLISRASPSGGSPAPQIDPRPAPDIVPTPLPAGSPFALPSASPALSTSDSYDFNQIARIGSNDTARLVQPSPTPSPPPAFGQWVRVRNSAGDLIGRYAFFIEDESMKVNVNVAGNNISGSNTRVNDLAIPATSPAPATQLEEIDPAALLPITANRAGADTALVGAGSVGSRVATRSTLGLLAEWKNTFPDYAHLATAMSRDDNTTARGWQRLDLNKIVADAEAVGTNAAKSDAAKKIADWIRDAWTGNSTLASLQYYQMFNDSRLRLQIAANIVDYIDQDGVPTDAGDVIPDGYTDTVPVLGIEKLPYAVATEIIYEASNSNGTSSATMRMKLQFRFLNLFEGPLDLADSIGRIEVKGVPIVSKNGSSVFDVENQTFTVYIADLKLVNGSGTCGTAGVCIVPAGVDGTSDSGAKTFQTDWLVTQTVIFTNTGGQKPRFLAAKVSVKVYGKNGERLDDTQIVSNLNDTGYQNSSGNSIGDFLKDATSTPLQVAHISLAYGADSTGNQFQAGDPRFRPQLLSDRWHTIDRTDATLPAGTNRIAQFIDKAELNLRAYGVDWYDYTGDRPLAFIRNKPMLNIGELGNIAAPEYPWRTLYLQHPERPPNTSATGPATDIPQRRSQSLDYVLVDLFRVGGSNSRTGALNINTQQQLSVSGATTLPLQSLFLGVPVGSAAPQTLSQSNPAPSADRVSAGVNSLVTSTTVAQSSGTGTTPVNYRVASISNKRSGISGEAATADNSPTRPYFQPGELAATLSRLLSASEASDTSGSSSTSRVVYSVLRNSPQTTTESNVDYKKDYQVEQAFREVSNSITTRGNVFRVLYVGQTIKDINKNGNVDANEVQAEYLGEAFVERQATFIPEGSNPDAMKTSDSIYKVVANRVITE